MTKFLIENGQLILAAVIKHGSDWYQIIFSLNLNKENAENVFHLFRLFVPKQRLQIHQVIERILMPNKEQNLKSLHWLQQVKWMLIRQPTTPGWQGEHPAQDQVTLALNTGCKSP